MEALLIGGFLFAPIHNDSLFYRGTHCPVDHSIVIKIGNALLVKFPLIEVQLIFGPFCVLVC